VFDPLRSVPPRAALPAFFVQAPDWFLLWVIATGGLIWWRAPAHIIRVGVGLALLLAALFALIMVGPLWDAIHFLQIVQFPYRLNTYVALGAAALVLVGILAVEGQAASRIRTGLAGALVGAIAISIGLCVWQLWVPDTHGTSAHFSGPLANFSGASSYANRNNALRSIHRLPRSFFAYHDYNDVSQPVVSTRHRSLRIDPARIDGNRVTVTVYPPAGRAPFATNIAGGPYAVSVSGGIVPVGRTAQGYTVARRTDPDSRGPVTVTISAAGGLVSVGRVVSLVAVTLLIMFLVRAVWLRRRAGWAGSDSLTTDVPLPAVKALAD
jgi:hypothetical protein